jgi:hypothetical protein
MEPSGRNELQPVAKGRPAKRLKEAETVATGCDQLPIGAHGKEGVDGSSPSEGSAKAPESGALSFTSTCSPSILQWVWSRLWSSQVQNAVRAAPKRRAHGEEEEGRSSYRRPQKSKPGQRR